MAYNCKLLSAVSPSIQTLTLRANVYSSRFGRRPRPNPKAVISLMKTRLVSLALSLASAPLFGQAPKSSAAPSLTAPLPTDPKVKVGTLPNGIRYYIRQNKKPEKRAELRLVVNAGSVLETDDQLGLAHFIEHMAFNGTTHFAKNDLVKYLESIGVRFGADLNGIFTANESSTVGMLLALQDIAKAGKIRFVGFDASQTLLDAMHAKQLDGVAVQNPMKMGYLGVKTMVEHLKGKPVEKRIDTGVVLVTPESMDTPEMKELTHPPIDKYLVGQ